MISLPFGSCGLIDSCETWRVPLVEMLIHI